MARQARFVLLVHRQHVIIRRNILCWQCDWNQSSLTDLSVLFNS